MPRPLPLRPRGAQYSVITVIAKPPRSRTTKGRLFFQPRATGPQPRPSLWRCDGPSQGARSPWPTTQRRTNQPAAGLGHAPPAPRRRSSLDHPPSAPANPPRARSRVVRSGPPQPLARAPAGRWDVGAFPCPYSDPSALPTPEELPWWVPSLLMIVPVVPPPLTRIF